MAMTPKKSSPNILNINDVEMYIREAVLPPTTESKRLMMIRSAAKAGLLRRRRRLGIRVATAAAAAFLILTAATLLLQHRVFGDRPHEYGTIMLETGDVLQVSKEADYTIISRSSRHRKVSMKKGRIQFDIAPLGHNRQFSVNTPHCRIEVTGTQFEVSVTDKDSFVDVLEGIVDVYVGDKMAQRLTGGTGGTFKHKTAHLLPSNKKASIPSAPIISPDPATFVDKLQLQKERTISRQRNNSYPNKKKQKHFDTSYKNVKALIAKGLYDQALSVIEGRLRNGIDQGRWLKLKGKTLAAAEQYSEAAKTLSKAADLSTGDSAVLCGYQAAELYFSKLSAPQKTLTQLTRVGATRNGSVMEERARVLEIKALLQLKRTTEVKSAIDAYLSRYPNTTAATWMKDVTQ